MEENAKNHPLKAVLESSNLEQTSGLSSINNITKNKKSVKPEFSEFSAETNKKSAFDTDSLRNSNVMWNSRLSSFLSIADLKILSTSVLCG